MKPYYEHAGITIYHGDCREVLASLGNDSVDVVVTSPPYNTLPTSGKASGLHGERKSGVNVWLEKSAAGYFDHRPEPEYQEWLRGIVSECLRVSRGLVWVNHKTRYRDGLAVHPVRFLPFDLYAEVIWDRGGSMALNCKRYAPSHETILGYGRPHTWNDSLNGLCSVWRIAADRGNDNHPCAFPESLPNRLIASSSNPGETVFEPFCGAGTTLRAAKNLGRKAIGCEIEERYCEIAANRLRQEVLFPAEAS